MLLATDMDGTVLPATIDDDARSMIRTLHAALDRTPAVRLAYVTGRGLDLACRGIESGGLPEPQWLACDVGTSLYGRDGARWRLDEGYRARLRGILGPDAAPRIEETILAIPGVTPQPAGRQGEFKHSFDAPPGFALDDLRAQANDALEAAGLRARAVVSRDPVTGGGLLDVLPAGASKRAAVEHLRVVLGLAPEEVVFAGDSGNDEEALLAGWSGIVVGNAPPDLKSRVARAASERGLDGRLYLARAACAAGVLEGARHFGLFPAAS